MPEAQPVSDLKGDLTYPELYLPKIPPQILEVVYSDQSILAVGAALGVNQLIVIQECSVITSD